MVTATWVPDPGNPSTLVNFTWLDPAFNVMQTHLNVPVIAGVATDTYNLPNNAVQGQWWVQATGDTAGPEPPTPISYEVAPFIVSVPEIAVLGTIGAAFAMIGAVIYRKKKTSSN
jgi:hypothetical protein